MPLTAMYRYVDDDASEGALGVAPGWRLHPVQISVVGSMLFR